jgi:hypothetical protein
MAADAPAQQLALHAALRGEIGKEDEVGERFSAELRQTKSLAYYKKLYEEKRCSAAIQSLLK